MVIKYKMIFMRPKKSLGQNFLKSEKALGDIVRAGGLSAGDTVLEIGPGKGALTEKILETGAKVIAVEKDSELIPVLSEKFAQYIKSSSLVLVQEDILEFDPLSYKPARTTDRSGRLKPGSYKLIGNIPYYITGAIIRKFLESDYQPSSMTLLVQKEVAERIVARDGKESILSISVKAFGEPKIIAKVPKRYFTPEPKVDSAVIHISDISNKKLGNIETKNFFRVVKAGFAHKRKVLAGNLADLSISKEQILAIFHKLGIDAKARAEDLSLSEWISIVETLESEV